MKRYLAGKSLASDEITEIIDRLKDLNYLNDHDFARQFIRNRIRFKPKSAYALGYELRRKGIDPVIADELLASLDDAQLAWTAALSKQTQWQHLDPDTHKKKLMNHLRYRGFHHGTCLAIWERLQTNHGKKYPNNRENTT